MFQAWSKVVSPQSNAGNDVYMRENLDALARKLGEMQARMVQIDALGDRVAGLAGINPEEFKKPQGAGGSLVQGQPMTLDEIMAVANGLELVSDTRMDWLTAVETRLFDQKMQTALQPTEKPVKDVMIGSRFGFRIDPFSGERAMHTGLDFPAEVGTPILAAAGGVVIVQEYHAAYGNMVEVDHGNGLVTRYAHASATFVKKGDIVNVGKRSRPWAPQVAPRDLTCILKFGSRVCRKTRSVSWPLEKTWHRRKPSRHVARAEAGWRCKAAPVASKIPFLSCKDLR